jgi:hypothetical protein
VIDWLTASVATAVRRADKLEAAITAPGGLAEMGPGSAPGRGDVRALPVVLAGSILPAVAGS